MAFERGHFPVPRETSLADLGEEIGVSDTAVSERLRRGIATLLSTTIEKPDREEPRI
jgi:predicted DNA binding protein